MNTLKSPTQKEIDNTFNWLQQKELREFFMLSSAPSLEQHLSFFQKTLSDNTQKYFSIFQGQNHIGNCGIKYLNEEPELWIYIAKKENRGKGFAYKACIELLTYFQERYPFSFIKLHVLQNNIPAINLYRKLGFDFCPPTEFDKKIWGNRIAETYTMKRNLNRVVMMQPTFLPWQGFFELIYKSDTFIFLDDFQYSVGSFQNRNNLFTSKEQVNYLTVPISKKLYFKKPLNMVSLPTDNYWKNQIVKSITFNYQKTPFFEEIQKEILPIILQDHSSLAALNIAIIKKICHILGFEKKFLFSSEIQKTGQRSELVYSILKNVHASIYFSASGSFEYMLEDKIFPCDIPVLFQNFEPKPYNQLHSKTFVPYLSVLDILFNEGINITKQHIINGTSEWLNWTNRKLQYKVQ